MTDLLLFFTALTVIGTVFAAAGWLADYTRLPEVIAAIMGVDLDDYGEEDTDADE